MPTFAGFVKDRQIIFITVASVSGEPAAEGRAYHSLLDTGAQTTCISEKVAAELGLVPIGTADIVPANGELIRTPKYRIRLDVPIEGGVVKDEGGEEVPETTLRGLDVDVAQLPYQPHGYDIILGLDFLYGFHVTMFRGTYILSS